jgi:aspartate beta-hydroxylase
MHGDILSRSYIKGELPLPSPLAKYHQPSEEHLDDLTARPFWDATQDVSNFPWAKKLEQDSFIIIQELEEKLKREEQEQKEKASNRSSNSSIFTGDSAWQNKVMGGGWSAFRLQRLGEWNVENCKEFPKTFELLRSLNIPFAVRGICFARQAAGSGVQPHSDGRNFILTSHLGLKIPKGCWIKVGDEEETWENGKLITIDTSFEHSTGNPTESDRHVLIIDFWHPETTEAERAALDFIYSLRNKYESGKIPFRKPRRMIEEEEGQGLQGMFRSLFSKQ